MEALATRREVLKYSIAGVAVGSVPFAVGGCNTSSWLNVVIADLPAALDVVTEILSLFGKGSIPANLPQQIQADLQLVQNLLNDYKTTPSDTLLQKIDAALLDVQQNLQAILQAVHIYNPMLAAAIAAAVGALVIIVTSIQALIPAPATATTARKALGQKGNGTAVIQTSMAEILTATGYASVIVVH